MARREGVRGGVGERDSARVGEVQGQGRGVEGGQVGKRKEVA